MLQKYQRHREKLTAFDFIQEIFAGEMLNNDCLDEFIQSTVSLASIL